MGAVWCCNNPPPCFGGERHRQTDEHKLPENMWFYFRFHDRPAGAGVCQQHSARSGAVNSLRYGVSNHHVLEGAAGADFCASDLIERFNRSIHESVLFVIINQNIRVFQYFFGEYPCPFRDSKNARTQTMLKRTLWKTVCFYLYLCVGRVFLRLLRFSCFSKKIILRIFSNHLPKLPPFSKQRKIVVRGILFLSYPSFEGKCP